MALFYNVLMKVLAKKQDHLLLATSLVMFLSYFISDHFNTFTATSKIYFIWFLYDVVTLLIVLICIRFIKDKFQTGVKYVCFGLIINSILFLSMYMDIHIYQNKTYWWLWGLYSTGVNLVDFMMIFALILNRDYLGLIRFSKFITSPIRKKALN
ncbi:hypothetical protein [Pseudoalteromonas sp. '520P1 No. 423']|nr:hypothetical protein [Pseudoalteromonas sp. '520P1 No. 423']